MRVRGGVSQRGVVRAQVLLTVLPAGRRGRAGPGSLETPAVKEETETVMLEKQQAWKKNRNVRKTARSAVNILPAKT